MSAEHIAGMAITICIASIGGTWVIARAIFRKNGNGNKTKTLSPTAISLAPTPPGNQFVTKALCDERHKNTENQLSRIEKQLEPIPQITAYIKIKAGQEKIALPEEEKNQ